MDAVLTCIQHAEISPLARLHIDRADNLVAFRALQHADGGRRAVGRIGPVGVDREVHVRCLLGSILVGQRDLRALVLRLVTECICRSTPAHDDHGHHSKHDSHDNDRGQPAALVVVPSLRSRGRSRLRPHRFRHVLGDVVPPRLLPAVTGFLFLFLPVFSVIVAHGFITSQST